MESDDGGVRQKWDQANDGKNPRQRHDKQHERTAEKHLPGETQGHKLEGRGRQRGGGRNRKRGGESSSNSRKNTRKFNGGSIHRIPSNDARECRVHTGSTSAIKASAHKQA